MPFSAICAIASNTDAVGAMAWTAESDFVPRIWAAVFTGGLQNRRDTGILLPCLTAVIESRCGGVKRKDGVIWMLTIYAKNEATDIAPSILRKIREEIDG
jgi:hypothetical protein